jgi:hypothetical protein
LFFFLLITKKGKEMLTVGMESSIYRAMSLFLMARYDFHCNKRSKRNDRRKEREKVLGRNDTS